MNNPWETEPDRLKWVDPATGLTCIIRRHPDMGFLCGYVRVKKVRTSYRVHGGITLTGKLHRFTGGFERGIWVGFDCMHAGDAAPRELHWSYGGTYRDMAYVKAQCESLARQIKCRASR